MTQDIDKIGVDNSQSNRDKLDNENFRKMMLAFGDSFPIDKIFDKAMSRVYGSPTMQLEILKFSEMRRVRYALEEIIRKMKG
jgi:hypothetical protein